MSPKFIFFLLILILCISPTVKADRLDFSLDINLLDEQGVVQCDENCLIEGENFYILNSAGVIEIEYNNETKIYTKNLIILPIIDGETLKINKVLQTYTQDGVDLDKEIIFDKTMYISNWDNLFTYGKGRVFNNPAFLIIPAMFFALALTITKFLYYKKVIL